jgi:hypothetical protein
VRLQNAKQLALNASQPGTIDYNQAITHGLAIDTDIPWRALADGCHLTDVHDINAVLDSECLTEQLVSAGVEASKLRALAAARRHAPDGILTASLEFECVTEFDILMMVSAGVWFRGSTRLLRRLIDGDPDLMSTCGLTAASLQPRCLPGQVPSVAPNHEERLSWAGQYVRRYKIVEEWERTKRVPFSKHDQLLVRLTCLDRCFHCRGRLGALHWHMEHTRRHACGGSNSIRNIRAVCCACHELKNSLDGSRRLGDVEPVALCARMLGFVGPAAMFAVAGE